MNTIYEVWATAPYQVLVSTGTAAILIFSIVTLVRNARPRGCSEEYPRDSARWALFGFFLGPPLYAMALTAGGVLLMRYPVFMVEIFFAAVGAVVVYLTIYVLVWFGRILLTNFRLARR